MIRWMLWLLLPDRCPGARYRGCRWGIWHDWHPAIGVCIRCEMPDKILRPEDYANWRRARRG